MFTYIFKSYIDRGVVNIITISNENLIILLANEVRIGQ